MLRYLQTLFGIGWKQKDRKNMDCSTSKEYFPLVSQQVVYWNLGRVAVDFSYGYTGVWAFQIVGDLDIDALVRSFELIVARHDALRLRIGILDRRLRQSVSDPCEFGVEVVDLTGRKYSDEMAESFRKDSERPYGNILGTNLFSVRILRVGAYLNILEWTIDHCIMDGWSGKILLRELALFYSALSKRGSIAEPPWPTQFSEYIRWQERWFSREESRRHIEYERSAVAATKLIGPAEALKNARPLGAGHRFEVCDLSSPELRAFAKFALSNGMRVSFLLTTIYAYALARWSGSEEFVICSAFNGRRQPEFIETFGCFTYQILIKVRLKRDRSFSEALRSVPKSIVNGYLHCGAMNREVPEWRGYCSFSFWDDSPLNLALDGLAINAIRGDPREAMRNRLGPHILTGLRANVEDDRLKVALGTNMLPEEELVPLVYHVRKHVAAICAGECC